MFNPQGRWDRKLPLDEEENCYPVEVFARFCKGKITPLCFLNSGVKVRINRINYTWVEKQGLSRIYYFSVSDNSENFCLLFNAESMSWKLRNLE